MQELPRKDTYKLSEVCQYTDTQPYVLRFWESEFPQLKPAKSASGQRLYRRRDIDLVQRIKQLLYDEEFTLERAREQLSDEMAGGKLRSRAKRGAKRPAPPAQSDSKPRTKPPAPEPAPRNARAAGEPETEMVARRRYEDAVDEIDHLRLALRENERACRKAQDAADAATARADKAIDYLERVLELLD